MSDAGTRVQLGQRSTTGRGVPASFAWLAALALVDGIALLTIRWHSGAAVFALMMLSAVLVALAQQTLP